MEKVYLLLRNNVESGPYTLNELLTQQLRPTDMLWIQGKSTAWTYLSEMELMIHEEPAAPATAAANTRLVGDEIEQKAEEIRKRALSFKPRALYIQQEPTGQQTEYGRHYSLPGEEEIELIDHRKKDNKTLNEVVMTSVIICLFAGGLYFGSSYFHSRKEIISPAATEIVSEPKVVETIPEVASVQPVQEHSLAADSSFLNSQTFVNNEKPGSRMALAGKNDSIKRSRRPAPVQTLAIQSEELKTIPPPVKLEANAAEKKEAEPAIIVKKTETKKEEPVKKQDSVASDDEEKKGLGKALSRLFRKKKNKDGQKED
ncbi:MAG: hypothetical protein ACXWB9_06515 [Flavisolibacter sp.]